MKSILVTATLVATAMADWATTFQSIIPQPYEDWWATQTSTLGLALRDDKVYVMTNVDGKISGAKTGGVQFATFSSTGQASDVKVGTEAFTILGQRTGGNWANPGSFVVDSVIATPGYWNLSKTLDFGVLSFDKSTFTISQPAVFTQMKEEHDPFPAQTVALQADSHGRRFTLQFDNGLVLKKYESQDSMVKNQTAASFVIPLDNVVYVGSFVYDEAKSSFYIMTQTRVGDASGAIIVKIQHTPDFQFTSTLYPQSSNSPYSINSQMPLLNVDNATGDLITYIQTSEPCYKCPFTNKAAKVQRIDSNGNVKWSRNLDLYVINNIAISSNIVLLDWQAVDFNTGKDVTLPKLPTSPAPFPLTSVGRKLRREVFSSSLDSVIAGPNPGTFIVTVKNNVYVTGHPRDWLTVALVTLDTNAHCTSGPYAITQPVSRSEAAQACEKVGLEFVLATQTNCNNGRDCTNYVLTSALDACGANTAWSKSFYFAKNPRGIWDKQDASSVNATAPAICKIPRK